MAGWEMPVYCTHNLNSTYDTSFCLKYKDKKIRASCLHAQLTKYCKSEPQISVQENSPSKCVHGTISNF